MEARTAGLVVEMRTRQTKQGKMMGFATLDDRSGRLELAIFGELYDKYRDLLSKDTLLVAEGSVSVDDYTNMLRLTVEKLYSIEQARDNFARYIALDWQQQDENQEMKDFIEKLSAVLQPFKGGNCPLMINYSSKDARASLQLGDNWRVHPTDELLSRLRRLLSPERVDVRYR